MAADERPSGPGGAIPDNKAASFARAFAKIMESAGPGRGLLQVSCHKRLLLASAFALWPAAVVQPLSTTLHTQGPQHAMFASWR